MRSRADDRITITQLSNMCHLGKCDSTGHLQDRVIVFGPRETPPLE